MLWNSSLNSSLSSPPGKPFSIAKASHSSATKMNFSIIFFTVAFGEKKFSIQIMFIHDSA